MKMKQLKSAKDKSLIRVGSLIYVEFSEIGKEFGWIPSLTVVTKLEEDCYVTIGKMIQNWKGSPHNGRFGYPPYNNEDDSIPPKFFIFIEEDCEC
jgi:hypothetical protein